MRIISVIISTMLGAAGIIVYEQSFGFIQLYGAPLAMPFTAIAAILIGGASVKKASMLNVVVGAFLDDTRSGRLLNAGYFAGLSLAEAVEKAKKIAS